MSYSPQRHGHIGLLLRQWRAARRISTTFGTPQDATLQELRIECFFPADETTRAAFIPA